ncbi:inner nuclear membrane protein enriched at telomere/subtelomere region, partial [Serendipita sp. 411]
MANKAVERRRVKALVKEALERVREQEAKHYLDYVTYPTSSLTSLQLRDELMQEEHSIAKRTRMWEEVEKIVEENSNVRSNME